MSKPTFNQRIEWLKAGRGPYLSFLRNLTPQILLASLAMLTITKIDFSRSDIDNTMLLLFCFLTFLLAFIAAFVANSTLLYDEAFGELRDWRATQHRRIKNQGLRGLSYGRAMWIAFWKERFAEFVTYLFMIIFFQVVFAGVVIIAMASAVNYLHLTAR